MSLRYCEKDIVNLSPIRWLQDPRVEINRNSEWYRYSKVRNHIEDVVRLDRKRSMKSFDREFPVELGIYTIDKKPVHKDVASMVRNPEWRSFERFIGKNPMKFIPLAEIDRSKPFVIFKDFAGGHGINEYMPDPHYTRSYYGYFVNGRNQEGLTPEEAIQALPHSTTGDPASWKCYPLHTEAEARNLFLTDYTHFVQFIHHICQYNADIYPRYMTWVGNCVNPRTGLKGYLSEWTDEDFYTYFKLTEEEIKLVDKVAGEVIAYHNRENKEED